MTDDEYQIRRKYENRNLMQELKWVSHYPPSGMSNQDKDFIRWLAITAYDRINELERKTGKWIEHNDDFGLTYECSVCHIEGMINGNYCYNCGAEMREREDDV